MRLVTAPELPKLQVTLVTTPEYPGHRTLFLEPEGAVEIVDLDQMLPGEFIQVRLWGDRRPITYIVRKRHTCLHRGKYVEQVNLYLRLVWPKSEEELDARLVSSPARSNVARITLMGLDRSDQYGPVPGLSRNTFRLIAQRTTTGHRLVHTPPLSA